MPELNGEQYDLLVEAIRKCFWYKKPLVAFLTRCGIPKERASRVFDASSKAEFFRELADEYSSSDAGRQTLYTIARSISRMKHFTGLDNECQIEEARAAAQVLRDSFEDLHDSEPSFIKEQAQAISKIPEARHASLRAGLGARLTDLFLRIGTSQGGHEFEELVCDLAQSEDLEVKRPYRVGNRKQFDGSVSIMGTVFLIESKFKSDKADAPEIFTFIAKVQESADLTQGIFISMYGYTEPAIVAASRAGSPIILLEGDHITNAVYGGCSFERMIVLAKRNASETGSAVLRWQEMKNRLVSM